jgi:hypothetical protein
VADPDEQALACDGPDGWGSLSPGASPPLMPLRQPLESKTGFQHKKSDGKFKGLELS